MQPALRATSLLLVEDSPSDATLVEVALEQAAAPGFELVWADTLGDAIAWLGRSTPDAVLLDLHLPDSRGGESLKRLLEIAPDVPVVVLTGLEDPSVALEAVRAGAQDYLSKNRLQADLLERSVRYAIERQRAQERIRLLNRLLRTLSETNQMIVRRTQAGDVLAAAARIAVEHGRFPMACAVRRDPKTGHFGWEGTEPLTICSRCFEEGELTPGGALAEVIATGLPVRVPVPGLSVQRGGRHAAASETATCAAFPVRVDGQVDGAFGVMAAQHDVLQEEVVALLQELAQDVGFALQVLRNEERRLEAEAALAASERRYRTLFENNLAGVLRVSLDGEIRDANEAAWRMFGAKSEAELRAVSIHSLHAVPGQRERLIAAAREGGAGSLEISLRRLDGTPFDALVSVSLIPGEDGEPVTLEGTMIDVSDAKRAEAELRQAQKLEAVGRLAGGVAHDFNNLLQSGLGLVDLLRLQDPECERNAAVSDELEAVFRRGAALTQRLLLFARQKVTEPRPEDLNALVEGLVQLLRRLLKENIELRPMLAAGPLRVQGDAGQLEQVIINLAVNAADAMKDGGILRLRTGRSGSRVWISVEDTGEGIPAEVRERIFEPFFTTKGPAGGSGLGLSVVHGIVAEHRGAIEVESEPGRGTKMRIVLPALEDAGVEEEAPAAGPGGGLAFGHGERVLVVEDQELVRNLLRHSLSSLGFQVVVAESAEEALEAEGPFDLLLSDVILAGANGPALAAQLRLRWPDLRVVLMSGYAEEDVMLNLPKLDPVHFLPKPFNLGTLSRVLQSALVAG